MDIFGKLFPSCDHTQSKLERKPAPAKAGFTIDLPGVGPAISITPGSRNSSAKGNYIYFCPNCKSHLPASQNVRWEALYNATHKPLPSKPSAKPVVAKSGAAVRGGSPKRVAIGAKLRYDVLTRDNYRCVKCGATKEDSKLHVDHKIPRSQGGSNDMSNLQTLCEKCNLGKGARRG